MIDGKSLFAEISNEPVCEDGEVVGYFVKNSRMNDLEHLLTTSAPVAVCATGLAPGVMYDPRTATTGSATMQAVAPVAVPDELLYMAADAIEDLLKNGNSDSSAAAWIDLPGKLRATMQSFGNSEQRVIQRYKLPDGWIKCSERMPENMDTVIISNGIDRGQGWWDGDSWQSWSRYDSVPDEVTHWMPLPAAPEQEV